MGVSGSGKSTIGRMLAESFDADFVDADDLHPAANKSKMAAGTPLDDRDREPWLEVVGRTIAASTASGRRVVVACSALKRNYRDMLRQFAPDLFFLHLSGDPSVISARVGARQHEFMAPTLLASQLAALEPLESSEAGGVVSLEHPPAEMVRQAIGLVSQLS